MHSSIALLAATVGVAVAQQTILINVGNGLFTFAPDVVNAAVGDTLEFHFFSALHTVVQGDFDTPCSMGTKKGSGFNSGPIKNKADGTPDTFQVVVKNTDPMWFYCGTPTHCQAGMSGVINPPESGNTIDDYRTAAADTTSSEELPNVQGGCISPFQSDTGMGALNCGGSSGGGGESSTSSIEESSSTSGPESSTSAPPASSTEESSAAETSSTAAATTSAPATTTAAHTSTGAPPSKTSSAAKTSATIVPVVPGAGSIVNGNAAVVGAVVAGLGFLVMLV